MIDTIDTWRRHPFGPISVPRSCACLPQSRPFLFHPRLDTALYFGFVLGSYIGGFLFYKGVRKAMMARDVLVQAIIIKQVDSTELDR